MGWLVRLLAWVGRLLGEEQTPMGGRVVMSNTLEVKHFRGDRLLTRRYIINRVITTAFVNALVDAFQSATYINGWNYHASGVGTNAEVIGDTTLQSEVAEARDAGTQVEGATANIYRSVATHTYAGSFAITEHGLLNASSGGVLMDRTVFPAINVLAGDRIEFTYELTVAAGG